MPVDTSESQSDQRSVPFPFLQRKQEQHQTYQQNILSEGLSPSDGPKSGPTTAKGRNSIVPYKTQSLHQPSPVAGSSAAPASLTGSKKPNIPNLFTLFNAKTKEIFQVRVNPVMTIGGLKSKISSKYNLQDENDIIIQFNGVQYDSKRDTHQGDTPQPTGPSQVYPTQGMAEQIIRRKHKHVQKAAVAGENNQMLARGGKSNKISRTPSPQARKFRQAGTRTGSKGTAMQAIDGGSSSRNMFAQHNQNVKQHIQKTYANQSAMEGTTEAVGGVPTNLDLDQAVTYTQEHHRDSICPRLCCFGEQPNNFNMDMLMPPPDARALASPAGGTSGQKRPAS